MCCLEGIIPRGEQLEQEPYFYQEIKVALVTLVGNQCRSVALTGDSLSMDLTILAIMSTELILT